MRGIGLSEYGCAGRLYYVPLLQHLRGGVSGSYDDAVRVVYVRTAGIRALSPRILFIFFLRGKILI